MPRKGAAPRRVIRPDPVFGNVTVSRLVNKGMQRGEKSPAEHTVYGGVDEGKRKGGEDREKVLDKALGNIMPLLEVRPRRVGGATYQVPIEVRLERRMSLGLRRLVDYAPQRKNRRSMTAQLAAEIL